MQRGSKAISGLYFPEGVISSGTTENTIGTTLSNCIDGVTSITTSPYSTPRKVWSSAEVNLLSNIPGGPEMVSNRPEVASFKCLV